MNRLDRAKRSYYGKKASKLYEKQSLTAIPTQLGVAVTSECNLKCPYCMRENFTPEPGKLTLEDMKGLLSKMPSINGVCVMGLCEPFLNKETPQIVNWLGDVGKYSISFTTNGTVPLTRERLECLTRASDFVISVDSPDPETMRFLRGGADLKTVMGSVRDVLDFKKDNGLGRFDNPPMHINSVITSKNFDQIPGLIEMFEPYADELTYLMVDPVSRPDYSTLEKPLMVQSIDNEEYEKKIKEFRKIANDSPLQVVGLDYMIVNSTRWDRCILSWTSPFIEANGDVYFCYAYRNVMGNVFKSDLISIWNSNRAKSFRQALLTDNPPLKQCRSCNFARQGWQPKGDYHDYHEDVIQ